MDKKNKLLLILFSFFWMGIIHLQAQAPKQYNGAEIQHAIQKLNSLGTALYFAAHPDDENTRVISWLANDKKVKTGYLSLTRGDGGQNRIGPEIRELLGVIRTQELLKARSIDGGEQFFSRANDFSYSKNPEETFTIWDRAQVLADAVWVIRNFRPDVIITRFPHTPSRTHGHHTAASQIAYAAFDAAGDPTKFPEQLKYTTVWQPKRLVWNAYSRGFASEEEFEAKKEEFLKVDVGTYYPLLGQSNNEIAGKSTSQHQCQAMGAPQERGAKTEYFQHLKGTKCTDDLFDGVITSWEQIKEGKAIAKLLSEVNEEYRADQPAASIPKLLAARKLLHTIRDKHLQQQKLQAIDEVIRAATGLYMEVVANDFSTTPGSAVDATIEVINRASANMELLNIEAPGVQLSPNKLLQKNEVFQEQITIKTNTEEQINTPYWLEEQGTKGMYQVTDLQQIGAPENASAIHATISLKIENQTLDFVLPVLHKRIDPVKGEVYRPFVFGPEVSVAVKDKIIIFADQNPKTVQLVVKSGAQQTSGTIKIKHDAGWTVSPSTIPYDFTEKGAELVMPITITPSQNQSSTKLSFWKDDQAVFEEFVINYDHIPTQQVYLEATSKLVRLDIQKKGEKIGYYMGAGDQIPTSLTQIGYEVTMLQDEAISSEYLKQFDAVIIGIRAYNTQERIKFHQPKFMEYVKQGGTMIVQYNTPFRMKTEDVGPYPIKVSTDRTTVEEAEVRFLLPDHPVLNTPNKITNKDFEGWVQERGLYFPNKWDEGYQAILSSNDPGETPKDGGLLITQYGKGYYVYTGYSWFRELPAGVPGAFRFYANLISLGK